MELQEKAIIKMLAEMKEEHSDAEDRIHVWLGQQTDEKLLKGILEKDKSINGSLDYAMSLAQERAQNGVAAIEKETVFAWVKDYFINPLPEKPIKPKSKVTKTKQKVKVTKEKKKPQDLQLSLFDEI